MPSIRDRRRVYVFDFTAFVYIYLAFTSLVIVAEL